METSFEEGDSIEQQPLPGEIIGAFESTHRSLVHSALRLHVSPTAETLVDFTSRADIAAISVGAFFVQNFFNKAETPIPLHLSVEVITNATEEIAEKTNIINPAWTAEAEYSEEDREKIIENLTGGDKDISAQEAQDLCNAYRMMVGNMKTGVLQSPNVSRFLKNQARKEQLREHAVGVGVAAIGTFLGAWLAQRRKK
jgi:hypothetical protein